MLILQSAKMFNVSPPFSCQSSAIDYEKGFIDAKAKFPADLIVSGVVQIKSDHVINPRHVIWFQCSDNKFRFQDTLSPEQGFFEFSNKKDFFKALRKQMTILFKTEQVELLVYGIEKDTAFADSLLFDGDDLV